MTKRAPMTRALRFLREHGATFTEHSYRYEERGGTRVSARELGVDEHQVVKTLVMEDDTKAPLMILMHGDREVGTQALARFLYRRTVTPCSPESVERHTGYRVGGTSPFGTRKALPVYVERTILDLPKVFVNGGARGFLIALEPAELLRLLNPVLVDVAAG